MSDNQSAAPAAPAAAETPATPASETPVVETKSTETPTETSAPATKQEVKADAAADKTGAEKNEAGQYEIKVDGKVLKLNEQEMIKYAQLGHAGQKRMQEAAEFEKKVKTEFEGKQEAMKTAWEKLQKALKEDPGALLEDPEFGHKKYELAKKWMADKIEQDAKSPEQKEIETLRKEREQLLKEKEDAKKAKEDELKKQMDEAQTREDEANMKTLETEMMSAFSKYHLPNSSATVDRMVGIIEFAAQNNVQITVDDAAKIVRDDIRKDIQSLANMLPDDEFEALLGETAIKKVKDNTLKKMKSPSKVETTQIAKNSTPEITNKPKKSVQDWIKPKF